MKNKQTIYYCIGLPASGKSCWAKDLVHRSNGMVKRANMDLLREMLDDSKWSKERETFVRNIHNQIVEQILKDGYSVVIDNTGFAERHKEWSKQLAKKYNCDMIEKFFDVPLLECIERDAKRGSAMVGKEVIYKMYAKYLQKSNPSNQNGERAFIFDIDGTLSRMNGRGPYELMKVKTDIQHTPVVETYKALNAAGYKIVIFSGREGICETQTKEWLAENKIEYDHFDMRTIGDNRSDTIVKFEMFQKIKNKYNIVGVFDDREQVCQMWRAIGLTCFQVDWGMF